MMEIIKKVREREKNKNSKVEELKIKSQAAMEYLMTYGWAILIIALALGVLYSLGIMNPKNFIPRAPPGSCFVFRPNGPGTTDFVSLQGTCGYLPMYVGSFNGVNAFITANTINVPYITMQAWVMWYKFFPDWAGHAIISNSKSAQDGYMLYQATGTPYNRIITFIYTSSIAVLNSNTLLTTNRWYHVVVTYDGQYIRLYINGALDNQTSQSGAIKSTANPFLIGSTYTASGAKFNGSIANVQIYSTALTPQEIQYLYQQGLGGGPIRLGSLVGWWPLNGDAKDYSGNNNHGTIYNVTFVQNYNPP